MVGLGIIMLNVQKRCETNKQTEYGIAYKVLYSMQTIAKDCCPRQTSYTCVKDRFEPPVCVWFANHS